MCIFVLIFNNKEKIITKIFIFAHFCLNIHNSFFIFCYLERLCLYNREIFLAAVLRQNSKTNMTKNPGETVIYKKNCDMIFLPYFPLLLLIIFCIIVYVTNTNLESWF